MIIKGKKIKADTITMWLNVLSFIIGVIFYIRFDYKHDQPITIIQQSIPMDSIIYLNTQLNNKIVDLQRSQDSLVNSH
jgi:hypothetical protein